jgi:hypothetical protein
VCVISLQCGHFEFVDEANGFDLGRVAMNMSNELQTADGGGVIIVPVSGLGVSKPVT